MHALRVLACLCGLSLAACGPIYQTRFDYSPPASGQGMACIAQCSRISDLCRENCDLKQQRCEGDAREQARRDYEDYVRERNKKNAPIKRTRDSFYYGSSCSSSSCTSECTTPYNQCFVSCGGAVASHQVCTAFCK